MANTTVILPCAVLGSIVLVMLVFIWWWFPRTWKKGNKQENEEIAMSLDVGDEDGLTQRERVKMAGQHAREYLQAIEARNKAREQGIELPTPVYRAYQRAPLPIVVADAS